MPLEMRTLGGTDSLMKAANTATDQGRASVEKKPEKDTDKRKMTYEEKQELSISLQNLPSEKLESAVQIIRQRNPGLFQQEDEIEVDIDSFDNETLWELHSHVNNYQKSISRNDGEARVVLQDRKEADHNMLGTKFTSATAEAPKDLGSGTAFCSNRTNWMEGRHCWCRKIIIAMYSTSWSVCFSGTHPTILWDAGFARENNSFTL